MILAEYTEKAKLQSYKKNPNPTTLCIAINSR